MSDPNKTCSNCKHGMSGEQGTKLFCTWEKAHMPPPVFRARLWGENPPVTKDEHAESCAHFGLPLFFCLIFLVVIALFGAFVAVGVLGL